MERQSLQRLLMLTVLLTIALTLNAGVRAEILEITSYDITQTPENGFGGWAHTYTGTMTDTGRIDSVQGYKIFDYSGGTGTLNDNIIGDSNFNTHLFVTGRLDDLGNPILPEITLNLNGTFIINEIQLFGGNVPGNAIPGALTGVTVEIGGLEVTLPAIAFGDLNAIGVKFNDRLVLTGTLLEGVATNKVILKNFVSLLFGQPFDQFSLTEIQVDGAQANDIDGDGYTVEEGDCDDNDPEVHPEAEEICGDGIDNNCDGNIDEGCVFSKTITSTLGNDPKPSLLDQDIFKITGLQDETVTVRLNSVPPEAGLNKRVTLVITDLIRGTKLFELNRSALPIDSSIEFPATGDYLIIVSEQPRIAKGAAYRGQYSLTIEGPQEVCDSLSPYKWIE